MAEVSDIRGLLEEAVVRFNRPEFIPGDPVSIPHQFVIKEDIEIAGFLTALISWGRRTSIIAKASELMGTMGRHPHDFILGFSDKDLIPFLNFRYRTFFTDDLLFILKALQGIYRNRGGLHGLFLEGFDRTGDMLETIHYVRKEFMKYPHLKRSEKHLSDPTHGSAAKRINLFLRWMIRNDHCGVDFGIWKDFSPSALYLPLDVHSGNVARSLGLLDRKANDRKSVEQLTGKVRRWDAGDPVKYDYALFGLGAG